MPRANRRSVRAVLMGALNSPELVDDVLDALAAADWRAVPIRKRAHDNPTLVTQEGKIRSRQLIEAAYLFDEISDEEGGERYSAVDFIAWYLPVVDGCVEERWIRDAR